LLVSGGHTQLIRVDGIGAYQLLGESLDDAAGEAFDKTAKLLGLGYPGGPEVARLAEEGRAGHYQFPRPMTDRPGLDFSFSGLKTHTLLVFNASGQTRQDKADIARAFQDAVVETLVIKSQRALQQTGLERLVVAGGVSANRWMRTRLEEMAGSRGYRVYFPRLEFCGDNGAMVAYAGYRRLVAGFSDGHEIRARPRWPLIELGSL